MNFKIWNVEYMPVFIKGALNYKSLKHMGFTLDRPWLLKTPDGRNIYEQTQEDAIKRMNIIINEVPL